MCVCVRVCVHLPLVSHHDQFSQDPTLLWRACCCLHVQGGGVAGAPGEGRDGRERKRRGREKEGEVEKGRERKGVGGREREAA